MARQSRTGARESSVSEDMYDLGPAPRELNGRSVLVTGGAGFIADFKAQVHTTQSLENQVRAKRHYQQRNVSEASAFRR